MLTTDLTQASAFPWSAVFGVVGTLAGFALNELSYALRGRREDRRQGGRARADLLEIRHRLKAIPATIETFRSKIPAPIPANAEFELRKLLRAFLPSPDELRKRYDKAVFSFAVAFQKV